MQTTKSRHSEWTSTLASRPSVPLTPWSTLSGGPTCPAISAYAIEAAVKTYGGVVGEGISASTELECNSDACWRWKYSKALTRSSRCCLDTRWLRPVPMTWSAILDSTDFRASKAVLHIMPTTTSCIVSTLHKNHYKDALHLTHLVRVCIKLNFGLDSIFFLNWTNPNHH